MPVDLLQRLMDWRVRGEQQGRLSVAALIHRTAEPAHFPLGSASYKLYYVNLELGLVSPPVRKLWNSGGEQSCFSFEHQNPKRATFSRLPRTALPIANTATCLAGPPATT